MKNKQHCWPCSEYYPKRHEQGEHCANGYKCCPERCNEYDYQADASLEACKDTLRINWLADKNQLIGNVQLPSGCVERNVDSLRGAIDDAMGLDV